MNICINCAHCQVLTIRYDMYFDTVYNCYYNGDLPVSPVSGQKQGVPRSCYDMRSEDGVCGPDGRFFMQSTIRDPKVAER